MHCRNARLEYLLLIIKWALYHRLIKQIRVEVKVRIARKSKAVMRVSSILKKKRRLKLIMTVIIQLPRNLEIMTI